MWAAWRAAAPELPRSRVPAASSSTGKDEKNSAANVAVAKYAARTTSTRFQVTRSGPASSPIAGSAVARTTVRGQRRLEHCDGVRERCRVHESATAAAPRAIQHTAHGEVRIQHHDAATFRGVYEQSAQLSLIECAQRRLVEDQRIDARVGQRDCAAGRRHRARPCEIPRGAPARPSRDPGPVTGTPTCAMRTSRRCGGAAGETALTATSSADSIGTCSRTTRPGSRSRLARTTWRPAATSSVARVATSALRRMSTSVVRPGRVQPFHAGVASSSMRGWAIASVITHSASARSHGQRDTASLEHLFERDHAPRGREFRLVLPPQPRVLVDPGAIGVLKQDKPLGKLVAPVVPLAIAVHELLFSVCGSDLCQRMVISRRARPWCSCRGCCRACSWS